MFKNFVIELSFNLTFDKLQINHMNSQMQENDQSVKLLRHTTIFAALYELFREIIDLVLKRLFNPCRTKGGGAKVPPYPFFR